MLKIAYWTSSPVFQYLSRISDETLEIADAKTLIKKDRSIYSSFESRKKLYSNQGEHTLTGTILMMASEVGVLSDERKRQFESLSEPNPLSSAPVPVTKESINIKLAWAMIESLSNLKKEAPKPGSLFLQFNPISLLGTGAIEALLITVVDWGMFLEFNVKTQEAMNRALDQIEQTSKDPVDIARCAEYRKINQ